jgi:hypothetical protein
LIGLAGAALAICLLLPLAGKYRKFPYSGKWVESITRRDGRLFSMPLSLRTMEDVFRLLATANACSAPM